jgi:Carboxypeptidase regulatory-like domain
MNAFRRKLHALCVLIALILMLISVVPAQHIRGAVEGTVSDPSGAVLSGANVVLENPATGLKIGGITNDRGYFNFQNLEAGIYTLTFEQRGFRKHVAKDVNVRVGSVTPLTITLEIGATEQVVEVTAGATEAAVDTSRSTVDGVVTGKTIDNLPLNGRNFLDLAQLEPGVQVRDGGDFDPTKNQMVGVSIGGRSGRSTRIQVDGVDITDETVGTTTANISNETIQEFQVSRSTLDVSTDLTSSGAVNIVTRSGSNSIHGSGFGFFRNEKLAADLRLNKLLPTPEKPKFDREIFGGRAGGFFIKNKWFWHAEYEQNNQDGQQFTDVPNFPQFTQAFAVPLDERLAGVRTDFSLTDNVKLFYRLGHNKNVGVTGFGGVDLSAFANLNNTNTHVGGIDYATSRWTHSGRFSYLNFNNFIVDANEAAGTPTTLDPAGNPILINFLNVVVVGPDSLAPQQTFQDNKQAKYDGSVVTGNHTFRFGASYNRIDEAVFASFFGLAPRLRSVRNAANITFANSNGGAGDPLNYPLTQMVFGNGLGAFSERPALGFNNGGTINDRLGFYFTDSWKIRRNFTLNFGVRYDYDSALSNSDLERTPKLAEFSQKLAGFVNNDKNNIAPQAGFAWDLKGNGKFVIRGGAGIFYETNVINNFLFDRVLNLPPGLGNDTPVLTSGAPNLIDPGTGDCLFRATNFRPVAGQCATPGGVNLFSQPIKSAIAPAQLMQQTLQRITGGLAADYPPPGVPPLFDQNLDAAGSIIFNEYKRPYGFMANIGFQVELKPGLVLSVDYLRNRGVHFNQITDLNRIGAANTLNAATARQAIADFHSDIGCPANSSAAAINCAIAQGASIIDYADFGLGGGSGLDGFAFQGSNPNFRTMGFIQSLGLSTYNAFTVNLRGRLGSYGAFRNLTGVISYALSRFETSGTDQDFLSTSAFNDAPTKFFGPIGLDRTHQFSAGLLFDLPWGFKLNTTTRMASSLAQSVFLSSVDGGASEIFFTDLDGDGTIDDPLPGTNRGAYGRSVKDGKALNYLINGFNQQVNSGAFTPAARALISAGLFTEAQLRALGAVYNNGNEVTLAPPDQVGLDSFNNTDVRFSWTYKIKESVSIQPMVEIFNIFNVANYDPPGNRLSFFLDGSANSINGTPRNRRSNRYGLGSGSFAPGIPRAFQFGIRVDF